MSEQERTGTGSDSTHDDGTAASTSGHLDDDQERPEDATYEGGDQDGAQPGHDRPRT